LENAEFEQAERATRRGKASFWLALLLMLGVCLYAIWRSALFRLDRVQIIGNERLSQADIMEVAGLAPGQLRWEIPAEQVAKRLEAEPWIREAKVTWKGNRLLIDLTEREPVGLLQYTGQFYLLLDDQGVILGQQRLDPQKPLPVITGLSVSRALRGQQLPHAGLLDALTLLAWTAEPLRAEISEVNLRADRYLRVFMTGGTTVDWGVLPLEKQDQHIQTQVSLFADYWEDIPRAKRPGCQVDLRIYGKVHGLGCE